MTPTLPNITIANQGLSQWHHDCRQYMLSINHQFDTSHQIDHVDRVLRNALQIHQDHPSDLRVIVPAVMLHDCVPIDKNSHLRQQASTLSAEHAKQKLAQWHYPDHLLSAIGDAIASHSFSANIPAVSLEAKIVQDADRLDSLGAIGMARCFMLGGRFGNPLYHENDPTAECRPLNDKAFTLDHFYTKLLKLHNTFLTETGKRLALERTQYMQQYIATLLTEINPP